MPNFIRSSVYCVLIAFSVVSCSSNVASTVKQDFGLQERPEDYVSGSERAMKTLRTVGVTEIKRLNTENQHGEVKYQSIDGDLNGKFYKEVKIYTRSYPISAEPVSRSGNIKNSGYNCTIDYAYEIYEGPRFSNRTNAEASDASVPSGVKGRDTYRYSISSSGTWDGSNGKATSR